jgi:xanthine/uracil permease
VSFATRVYSTLVYVVGGVSGCPFATIVLLLCPKIGAVIDSIPRAVVGGAVTVLYGLIVVLGIRLFVEDQTDFRHPVKLALVGAADHRRRRWPRRRLHLRGRASAAR